MNKNHFLAKSSPLESIQEHTDNLIKMYKQLKDLYYNEIQLLNWNLLYLACLHHDLGKMNSHFQNKLYKQLNKKYGFKKYQLLEVKTNKEIPHGCLSASLISKNYLNQLSQEEKQILIWVVYYHHYRKNIEDITADMQNEALDNDIKKYINEFKYDKLKYKLSINYSLRRYLDQKPSYEENKSLYYQYVITKGFLNKIDYAASSRLDKIEINYFDLLNKLDKNKGFNEYNKLQNYVKENSDKNLIVVASTGMGKTEAGLLWVGNNKGFFTLPLKVSINAIYKRILNKIKFNNVGLLHSDTISEYINLNDQENLDLDYYNKTKQLSLPLTVCTLDQIIDVVYKYPNYEYKFATFSYSKIIIDEIQMYSPHMLGLLIIFLKQLSDVNGKFMIMTATLPEIFIYFMNKYKIPYEDPKTFTNKINRHKVKIFKQAINVDKIVESYRNKKKKILVIVNTVKKAQELFNELKNTILVNEINIFHSRFIQKERNEKSNNIFIFGQCKNKETGIWITTQIVEASLDIDFDELYTELSDISGLIQRMGRVFRKRKLNDENKTNIFVYVGKNYQDISGVGIKTVIDKEIFEISKENLLKYNMKILTEENKFQLVKNTYSYERLKNTQYFKTIEQVISSYINVDDFVYDKNDVNLRNIDTVSVIPINIYKDNKNEIDNIIRQISNKVGKKYIIERQKLINTIKEYTIQIERYRLYNADVIHNIIKISNNLIIYIVNYEYDDLMGLTFNIKDDENIQERFF